jgi:type II restriction enzyme
MANDFKTSLLDEIERRCGSITRLTGSRSLIELSDGVRVYLRYSKLHARNVAFFGLRQVDLNVLEGHRSYICFFTDREQPLFIPYNDFEGVIRQSPLATDGQYKVQIAYSASTRDLYLPRMGHFNVDAYGGIDSLHHEADPSRHKDAYGLSHWQVQTLLGGIGVSKGYSVFVPQNNADLLDWTLTQRFQPLRVLPAYIAERTPFASEIDVIWVDHRQDLIAAAFEVEHSTAVYSGLLRFNDLLLTCPTANRFFVVSNEARRDLFVRQLQRPTFQRSGLSELASFLDYANVLDWHRRLASFPPK